MRTTKPTWVEFGRELLEYTEVKNLAECMAISRVEAAGYVALVVALGLADADDGGQVDHLTDKAIETACCWEGERGELVRAFVESGVFQGHRDSDAEPLSIAANVWDMLAGASVKRRIDARRRQQEKRRRDSTN